MRPRPNTRGPSHDSAGPVIVRGGVRYLPYGESISVGAGRRGAGARRLQVAGRRVAAARRDVPVRAGGGRRGDAFPAACGRLRSGRRLPPGRSRSPGRTPDGGGLPIVRDALAAPVGRAFRARLRIMLRLSTSWPRRCSSSLHRNQTVVYTLRARGRGAAAAATVVRGARGRGRGRARLTGGRVAVAVLGAGRPGAGGRSTAPPARARAALRPASPGRVQAARVESGSATDVLPRSRSRKKPQARARRSALQAPSIPRLPSFKLEQHQLDLIGLGLVALAAFLAFVFYLGWDGGKVGEGLASAFVFLFGGVGYLVPVVLFGTGAVLVLKPLLPSVRPFRSGAICLLLALMLGLAAGSFGLGPDHPARDGFFHADLLPRPRRRDRRRALLRVEDAVLELRRPHHLRVPDARGRAAAHRRVGRRRPQRDARGRGRHHPARARLDRRVRGRRVGPPQAAAPPRRWDEPLDDDDLPPCPPTWSRSCAPPTWRRPRATPATTSPSPSPIPPRLARAS